MGGSLQSLPIVEREWRGREKEREGGGGECRGVVCVSLYRNYPHKIGRISSTSVNFLSQEDSELLI